MSFVMSAVTDRLREWPIDVIARDRLDDLGPAADVDEALASLRAAGAVVVVSGVVTIVSRASLHGESSAEIVPEVKRVHRSEPESGDAQVIPFRPRRR